MITTLPDTTLKAVKTVYHPASKLPKHLKDLPILHTLKISTHEGRMTITSVFVEDGEFKSETETVPARIEAEFETCVPAKPFIDWLRASQLTPEEKRKGERIQLKFYMGEVMFPEDRIRLYVQAGNTRTMFYCLNANDFPERIN